MSKFCKTIVESEFEHTAEGLIYSVQPRFISVSIVPFTCSSAGIIRFTVLRFTSNPFHKKDVEGTSTKKQRPNQEHHTKTHQAPYSSVQ